MVRKPNPPVRKFSPSSAPTNKASDPLEAYRLNSPTASPTYSYGSQATPPSWIEPLRTFNNAGAAAVPAVNRTEAGSSAKSSIVFMRSSNSSDLSTKGAIPLNVATEHVSLLAPGTRLLVRLEAAATTAVKTPVVASVEYNYEHNGIIVVPAGAKVIGEVQQASAQGYLSVRFHTLQMPNGSEEKIEALAMGLDQKPLKGGSLR
jgi:type IV secretory pathway VirB10-like protein